MPTGNFIPPNFNNYTDGTVIKGALSASVEIPEGEYNPLIGLTYMQIARVGLGNQKSQSGGTGLPPAEAEMTPYHRFASVVSVPDKESSFFDGIDISLTGIASLAQGGDAGFLKDGLSQINSLVEKSMSDFSAPHPEAIAPTLARRSEENERIDRKSRRQRPRRRFQSRHHSRTESEASAI